MEALEKNSNNPPQVCQIDYIGVENVSTFNRVNPFAVLITLAGVLTWNRIYGTPSNISFIEKSEMTASGMLYRGEVKLWYPGLDHNAIDQFSSLVLRPLLLKITYQNGTEVILGNPEEPVRIIPDFESGTKTGYNVLFSSAATERYRILYSDISEIP